MAKSFPPDVLVLDSDSLLHARLARGKRGPRIVQSKTWRIPDGAFAPAAVTPELVNESALADVLRRLKAETGRWDKASLLLPDSWFRINILDLPAFKERQDDAPEIVRWSLKRTLPMDPAELRIAFEVVARTHTSAKVLAVSAVNSTLTKIERVFADAGIELVLIEPLGLSLWNAIAVRENGNSGDRVLVYVRDREFTTAVFRGAQPLFIRSRNLSGERTVQQEIRLSASYLRDSLQANGFQSCFLAGPRDQALEEAISAEFNAPVRAVSIGDFAETATDVRGMEAELTACTGVFTA